MTAFLFDCPEKKINAADDMDYVICQYDYPFEIFVKKVNQKYYIFCYCFFFYYFQVYFDDTDEAGLIAGVVIGVVVFLAAIGVAIYCYVRHKNLTQSLEEEIKYNQMQISAQEKKKYAQLDDNNNQNKDIHMVNDIEVEM